MLDGKKNGKISRRDRVATESTISSPLRPHEKGEKSPFLFFTPQLKLKQKKKKMKSFYYVIGTRPQASAVKKGLRAEPPGQPFSWVPLPPPSFLFIAKRLKCEPSNL